MKEYQETIEAKILDDAGLTMFAADIFLAPEGKISQAHAALRQVIMKVADRALWDQKTFPQAKRLVFAFLYKCADREYAGKRIGQLTSKDREPLSPVTVEDYALRTRLAVVKEVPRSKEFQAWMKKFHLNT